jgi:nitroreductase
MTGFGAILMVILDAIKKRYSCRAYQQRAIEAEKLNEILEAARLAPSARNMQDWRFVVVTDKDTKLKLAEAANNQMFIAGAGAIIAGCTTTKHEMRCGQPAGPIDVAIALEHIALQATQSGLATCWIGSFYADKVRKILDIPEDIAVIQLMALGYPADKPKEAKREPVENIACREKWQF